MMRVPAGRLIGFGLCTILIALSGCRHALEAPLAKLDTAVKAAAAASAAAEAVSVPRELDLQTAKQIAMRHNPSVASLQARIEAAAARLQQARAAYFPRVEANASATHLHSTPTNQFGAFAVQIDPYESYSVGLSASWLIFDAFARRYRLSAARADAGTAAATKEDLQRTVLQGVAELFYAAQLAQAQGGIAQADIDFNSRYMADAETRRAHGAGSRSDVLNFRIRVDAARIRGVDAQRDRTLALLALGELMGLGAHALPVETVLQLSETETAHPDLEQALATARAKRADLAAMRSSLAAAEARAKAEYAALFPTIALTGDLGAVNRDQANFAAEDRLSSFGAVASWELFSGGEKWQSYRAARAEVKALADEVEALDAVVEREVRQQVQSLLAAADKLVIQRDIAGNTRQIRDDVGKEYKAGAVTLTRLNEAQRDLVLAEENLAVLRIEQLLTAEHLAAAVGDNLPE